jgi:hypothetical protein
VWRKSWLVIILCTLLTGCSATRLLYNQLDWGIVWYLNGFFSLDGEQKDALRESVERNLQWHRDTQLPQYAELARALEQDITGPVTVDLLEARNDEIIAFWDVFVLHTVPDVAAFFLLLNQEQLDEFLANLEEENSELWDEYAGETPEERIERRDRSAIKGIRRIVGPLDEEQEVLIRSHLSKMNDVADEWMVGRRLWQEAFVKLIKTRPIEPEFSERLVDLMLDPNQFDSSEYRAKVEENFQITLQMLAELINDMNDQQRARLSGRLSQFAADFDWLSVQKE